MVTVVAIILEAPVSNTGHVNGYLELLVRFLSLPKRMT